MQRKDVLERIREWGIRFRAVVRSRSTSSERYGIGIYSMLGDELITDWYGRGATWQQAFDRAEARIKREREPVPPIQQAEREADDQ